MKELVIRRETAKKYAGRLSSRDVGFCQIILALQALVTLDVME